MATSELFASLYDAITVLLRHTKYLLGNKLCLILESRDHLHRLNYSACNKIISCHDQRLTLKKYFDQLIFSTFLL